MSKKKTATKKSAFNELGLKKTIDTLKSEIQELYLSDDVPWIIGYSGGKDSSAVLQLTWLAIADLPAEKRTKTIEVISTDTLVENPIVALWVTKSHDAMIAKAEKDKMPFKPNRLMPSLEDSFWVNLMGKGYPAPRHKFRWCTDRLKIQPSNRFITGIVNRSGEAILLLGSRKSESSARSKVMRRHEKHRVRDRLSPNGNLPNTLVYTPIETWTNDDVWMFLMQVRNPWGFDNKDLLTLYQGASPDGECPLVVDSSTPSCGDSRFGCWVCTLVDKDKSMTAMIQNDQDKDWMLPLLKLRNELDFREADGSVTEKGDRDLRDFRRMGGYVQLHNDRLVHGPYLQTARERWLRLLLEAQIKIREIGPKEVANIELITLDEMQEIRRIWVVEKHELEDSLPRIYQDVVGEEYPGSRLDDNLMLGSEELELLKEICNGEPGHFEMMRELLSIEKQQRTNSRRAGLFGLLEKSIKRHYYEDEKDALEMARRHNSAREKAEKGERAVVFSADENEDSDAQIPLI